MLTLAETPPVSPAVLTYDTPDAMAADFRAALIFTAGGFTGQRLLTGKDPQDCRLFAGIAPVVDMLLDDEELTPQDAAWLLGCDTAPVPEGAPS